MPSEKAGSRHAHRTTGRSRSPDNISPSTQTSSSILTGDPRRQAPRRASSYIGLRASSTREQKSSTSITTKPSGQTARSQALNIASSQEKHLAACRDSYHSILEDPFFQEYSPPILDNPDDESSNNNFSFFRNAAERDDKDPTQRWPQPRRESLTIGTSEPLVMQVGD